MTQLITEPEGEETIRVPKKTVKMILELYARGYGYRGIAKKIQKTTTKTKNIGRDRKTIKRIVEIYFKR